jgi:hypothetical protein
VGLTSRQAWERLCPWVGADRTAVMAGHHFFQNVPVTYWSYTSYLRPPTDPPPRTGNDGAPRPGVTVPSVCATIFNFLRHKFQSDRSALGGFRTCGQCSFTGNDPEQTQSLTVWEPPDIHPVVCSHCRNHSSFDRAATYGEPSVCRRQGSNLTARGACAKVLCLDKQLIRQVKTQSLARRRI